MIPTEAIEKAVAGGWRPTTRSSVLFGVVGDTNAAILDPTFWQSLGKALGWEARDDWQQNAHRFYDLILTGGDTKKFWDELLT